MNYLTKNSKKDTQRKIKNKSKQITIKKSIKHKGRQPEGKHRRATKKTHTFNRIVKVSYFRPIITLNVNALNFPVKRHWVFVCFFVFGLNGYKNKAIYILSTETHFRFNDTQLSVKEWEKIFHANGNQKRIETAILIANKIDVKYYQNTKKLHNYKMVLYVKIYNLYPN